MSPAQTKLNWEKAAEDKYTLMIEKIPLFHRQIAKKVVDKKAEQIALGRGSDIVEESDIIQAFLSEVPMAFYSLMVRILDEVGFDYKKYEPK